MSSIRRSLPALIALAFCGRLEAQAGMPDLRRSADSLMTRQQFDQAKVALDRLVSQEPEDGRLWLRLGDAEAALGHPLGAIAAYRAALGLGFGSRAERSYRVARLYAGLGARDSAMAWLGRALEARYEHRPSIGTDSAFAAYAHDAEFRRLAGLLPEGEGSLSRDAGWRFDVAMLAEEAKRMATGPNPVARSAGFDSPPDDVTPAGGGNAPEGGKWSSAMGGV